MAWRIVTGKRAPQHTVPLRSKPRARSWDLSGADIYHRSQDSFIVKNERTHGLYPLGQNFCFFVGRCTEGPRMGRESAEQRTIAWFRIVVPDLLDARRNLFLMCRADNDLANWTFENVCEGTEVAVTGQLYTGIAKKDGGDHTFNYLIATRVSANLPMLPERDGKYVRVRADVVQHLLANVSAETRDQVADDLMAEMEATAKEVAGVEKPKDALYHVVEAAQDDKWFLRPNDPSKDDIEVREDEPE